MTINEQIVDLHAKSFTYLQIARRFEMTRSAVSGVVYRNSRHERNDLIAARRRVNAVFDGQKVWKDARAAAVAHGIRIHTAYARAYHGTFGWRFVE